MANKIKNIFNRDIIKETYDYSQDSSNPEFVRDFFATPISKIAQPIRKVKSAASNVKDQFSNIGSNIKDQLTGRAGIPGYQKQDVNFGEAIAQGFQEGAYDYQAPSIEESSTSSPAGYGKYLEESLTNINQVSGRRNSYIAQKSSKMFGPNKYRNQ